MLDPIVREYIIKQRVFAVFVWGEGRGGQGDENEYENEHE